MHVFRDVYDCKLIDAFKHFQDAGFLEIITCGATHGYFPILYVTPQTVRAQIAVGVQTYKRFLVDNLVVFGFLNVVMSQKLINI